MRRALWLAAAAIIFFLPAAARCQQQDQQSSASAAQAAPKQDDSLAAAARRAREQKKEAAKPAKIIDNDNIPAQGGISAVGTVKPETGPVAGTALEVQTTTAPAAKTAKGDEKSWRKKFTDLRGKLETDKQELEILQRELGVVTVQYYSDPNKALQQDLTRQDINDKTAKIEAKKKQIEADQQAISDAEDDLRRSGGDPGWAR